MRCATNSRIKRFQVQMRLVSTLAAVALLIVCCRGIHAEASQPGVTFESSDGRVVVFIDGAAVATYVYDDDQILRPYFAHVKTRKGVQVTRNHPPRSGDRDDHATMHPGIWLAFGDISSHDFWRNKASVRHASFSVSPRADGDSGSFTQLKHYVAADGTEICEEEFRCVVRMTTTGYRFEFDSVFTGSGEFWFGDQEEMGLGVRVATSISEVTGGRLLDSEGRTGANQIWSQAAAWCDYSGEVNGHPVGITIMGHPDNIRTSWWHARDYGLLASNMFGRAAMKKGQPSRIVISPGKSLRLRYSVWVHGESDADDISDQYTLYSTFKRN